MRYIVVGLGKLGSIVAEEFTQMGNEVIGVDKDIERVEKIKSKISTAICMNITDSTCLNALPLKGVFAIIITISKDIGDCLTTYSILKEIKNAKIYVRVADDIQASIMKSLGITNIIFPERESARRYAMSLEIPNFISSYHIDDDHYIVQLQVPSGLIGYKVDKEEFNRKFKLKFIAVKRGIPTDNALGIKHNEFSALEDNDEIVLQDNDIIVLYGHYKDLNDFYI